MGLGVAYAHGWSLGRRKMTRPLRADEAAGLHAIGRPYAAILSEGARPVAALTVNLGFRTVIVTYLGEDLRQTHSHVFWVDKDDPSLMMLHEMSFFEVPLGHGPRPAKLHFKHHEGPWALRASIPDAEGNAPLREIAGVAPEAWESDLAAEVPSFGAYDHLYRPEAYDALDFRLTEAGVHG